METLKNFKQLPSRKALSHKGIAIAILTLVLLIPSAMIKGLIEERQERSYETIQKINEKWSISQTMCAPLLLVPYTIPKKDTAGKVWLDANYVQEDGTLFVTPKELKVDAALTPEERYYGIYKAILYKSDIHFKGNFSGLADLKVEGAILNFSKAKIAIGITDLKGVTQNPSVKIGGKTLEATVGTVKLFSFSEDDGKSKGAYKSRVSNKTMIVDLKSINLAADSLPQSLDFDFTMKLNGSSSLNFIPIGQQTSVAVSGQWASPSFAGGFSPESSIDDKQFKADWNVLSFNREIPETWRNYFDDLGSNYFGVNLIETVDHYQQNMRTAKYALMFIALTFIVFFFVEIFTKKPIQFFQYVLVGIALILFYSLLLSLSEQIGFGLAYLSASSATILLITAYFYSLIKQIPATLTLAGIMIMLYAFLYVILQQQDSALLLGSIFLFVILAATMFVSNKIKFAKDAADASDAAEAKN